MSYAGLGAGSDSATITITTRTLQQMLRSRGIPSGPIDGVWGSQTLAAVQVALRRPVGVGGSGILVKGGGTSVIMPESMWSAIKIASPPPRVSMPGDRGPIIPSKPMDITPTEGGTEWVPWAIGSVALLGAAGFVAWTGRNR